MGAEPLVDIAVLLVPRKKNSLNSLKTSSLSTCHSVFSGLRLTKQSASTLLTVRSSLFMRGHSFYRNEANFNIKRSLLGREEKIRMRCSRKRNSDLVLAASFIEKSKLNCSNVSSPSSIAYGVTSQPFFKDSFEEKKGKIAVDRMHLNSRTTCTINWLCLYQAGHFEESSLLRTLISKQDLEGEVVTSRSIDFRRTEFRIPKYSLLPSSRINYDNRLRHHAMQIATNQFAYWL